MSIEWDGGGLATLAGLVYAAVYQPWSKEAKLKRKQDKVMDLFIAGDPGTKGLIERILPAPERMQTVERACAENEELLRTHDKRIGDVEKLANDDHDVLLSVKDGVDDLTREFVAFRDFNGLNGGDGPGLADTLQRIAKHLGVDKPGAT